MKLVAVWNSGDGCTFSCQQVQPVEYGSGEAFLVDFEVACKEAKENTPSWEMFSFAHLDWSFDQFFDNGVYWAPELYELEEWFDNNKRSM